MSLYPAVDLKFGVSRVAGHYLFTNESRSPSAETGRRFRLSALPETKIGQKTVNLTMVIIQYTWIHIPEFHDLPRIGRGFVEVF
jgi:hypothetical protein